MEHKKPNRKVEIFIKGKPLKPGRLILTHLDVDEEELKRRAKPMTISVPIKCLGGHNGKTDQQILAEYFKDTEATIHVIKPSKK